MTVSLLMQEASSESKEVMGRRLNNDSERPRKTHKRERHRISKFA